MNKKIMPIVATLMLSAQLVTIPNVHAEDLSADATLNVVDQNENPSMEDGVATEPIEVENSLDSILNNDDKLSEALQNDEDVTQLISDEIAEPTLNQPAVTPANAETEGANDKAVNKVKEHKSTARVDGSKANVTTAAEFVSAWNNAAIDTIELQNDITIPNNQSGIAQGNSLRKTNLEIDGGKFSLNLNNNSLFLKTDSKNVNVDDNGTVTGGMTLYVHDFSAISSTATDTIAAGNNGKTAGIFVDLNVNNAYGNWKTSNGNWRAKFENITVDAPSSHLTMMSRCEVTFAGDNNIKTINEPLVVGSVIFAADSHTNLVSANPTPIIWMNNEKIAGSSTATGDSREVTLQDNAKVSLRNEPGTAAATSTVVSPGLDSNSNTSSPGAFGAIAWAFGNITVNTDAVLDIGTAAGGVSWYNRPNNSAVVGPGSENLAAPTTGGFGNVYVNGGILNLHSSMTGQSTNAIIRNVDGDASRGSVIAINE